MAVGADYLFFLEDDNCVPETALVEMMKVMAEEGPTCGVVPVAYPIGTRGTRWNSIYREDGEVLFCGLGTTLIRRKVFEKLGKPWFDLSRWYGRVPDGKGGTRLGLINKPYPPNVGGIDVAFHLRVRDEAGFTIHAVPNMIGGHIRIKKAGATSGSGINDQPHTIEIWDTIDADQRIFVAEDRSRFYSVALHQTWNQGFRVRRPWVTKFWLADYQFGGDYDATHDSRIKLCREKFPEVKTVLELGSFEGGHTVALARWAEHVTGVEGRQKNAEKARWILKVHDIENAGIVSGNLEDIRLADLGSFDLCVSIGVLYHMPEPLKLIAAMADAAPNLFLWTHVAKDAEREDWHEEGVDWPLAGLSDRAVRLPKTELLAELRARYRKVEVLGEETDHKNAGPAITIAARQ